MNTTIKQNTRVLVIGSVNMDLVTQTQTLPKLGETLLGQSFQTFAGGKGANQAVAAARLGATVSLIACVGNDAFGDQLVKGLEAENIKTDWIFKGKSATGLANIILSDGDNAIIVVSGANHELKPSHLDEAKEAFENTDIVLAQLETPLETVEYAAQLAHQYQKPFILNPAPAQVLPQSLLNKTTLLTPNEHELLLSLSELYYIKNNIKNNIKNTEENNSIKIWEEILFNASLFNSSLSIVMTNGKNGAYFIHKNKNENNTNHLNKIKHVAAFKVNAIDSTGAGDTFNGALAAFWHLGLEQALYYANGAAALSVTKKGAQSGMPTQLELENFLNHFK